ncbi:MAG: TetR family transcriptional regulator, partial [Actinomycetota bacterium]
MRGSSQERAEVVQPGQRNTRRMDLLDAADNVVRRDGPEASMQKIAAEAGITKPILYRQFGDKGGLYRALADRYARALMAELSDALERETDPRARLTLTIDTYLAFLESEPQVYRFLVHRAAGERREIYEAISDFIRQIARQVADNLRADLDRYGIEPEAAEPWAFGLVGMVQLAADWWLERRTIERRQLVAYLVTLVWDG